LEAHGTAFAPGGDVARLAARAVRDCDFADRSPDPLEVEQGLGLPPDTIAVAVELHCGDPLYRFSAAFLANAVISLRGLK
jgi:hypothetical protein